jgi:hypothetical protein
MRDTGSGLIITGVIEWPKRASGGCTAASGHNSYRRNVMKKILIDHINEGNESLVMRAIDMLAASHKLQYRVFYSGEEEKKPAAASSNGSMHNSKQRRTTTYTDGKKDKGISGIDLVLKTIKDYGPVTMEEITGEFISWRFAPQSAKATVYSLMRENIITRDDEDRYSLKTK